MSLRRRLGRATSLVIFGIGMQFASALPQGELYAQTAPKAGEGSGARAQEQQKIAASATKMPLFFEANQGQTDPSVRFLTRSGGYTMFLTPTETVLVEGKNGIVDRDKFGKGLTAFRADAKNSKQSVLRMELLGANAAPEFQGLQELPGKVNYLIGKDEAAWHTNVALFSEVQVAKVYPGVDLLFHGDQRQLEYDFVVAPGADPGRIGFKIRGARKVEIAANGDLILHTTESEFEMRKPVIYQGEGANRSEVRGKFVLSAKNQVRFELGPYDHAQKLVIDPAIDYATFLGGKGIEISTALAVDSSTPGAPKIYATGATSDITTFPSGGTPINNPTGAQVLYISEIDPTKTGAASLVYLTFIGGSTPFQSSGLTTCETDAAWLALDESHAGGAPVEPVIGGQTNCADYPGTFITPGVTGTGVDGAFAAMVTRLASTGTSIDKSVLLGGNGEMTTAYVFVDATGNVLVTGAGASTNLPTITGAYVSTFNNGSTGTFDDCYTAKLQRSDLTPVYFSYLNMGAGSVAATETTPAKLAVCGGVIDSNNPNILYIGGNTFSTVAFAGAATSALGFQSTFQGTEDAFLMKLDMSVSGAAALQYATYIGGGGRTQVDTGAHELGTGLAVLAGTTSSNGTTNAPNIPLGNSLQDGGANAAAATNGETGFLTVMDTTKSGAASLVSGSYYGGSSGADEIHSLAYDPLIPNGFYIIVGGTTGSSDFPTLHPFQASLGTVAGTVDGFVAAFFITPTSAVTEFSSFIGGGTNDVVSGVDIDSNHAIYATATTDVSTFFGNTSPATTVNGFQPACKSCTGGPGGLPDATIFALTSAASATFTAQILAQTTTLAKGSTEQLNVLGTYDDGTFQDLTSKAAWISSNPSAATVSSSGLVTAVGAGLQTTITASIAGVAIQSVTITVPAVTGLQFNLVLEGTAFGTVMDNVGQINCTNSSGQGATGTCSTTYPAGTKVILTQVANPGSVFAAWGVAIGDATCAGATATCTFTIDEQEEITATFNNGAGNFTLSVFPAGTATGGGTVTGAGSISCTLNGANTPTGTCSATVASGSIETLTALPNQTSNFTSWGAPCTVPTGQPAKCVVTMSQNQQVNPLFTLQGSSFTVALTGNGTITSTSAPTVTPEIDCANPAPPTACSANFTAGTSVSLTATPATGYSFSSWTAGPCNGATAPTCAFVVGNTAATSATALFTINTFLLTVNRAGTQGGTVTSNAVNAQSGTITCGPAAGVQGCAVNATFNTAVTLTETPPSGGTFSGWSGTPTTCTVSGATCTFNMPAGPETVTATFATGTTAPPPVLTVTKTHTEIFAVGDEGDTYTVTVSNTPGAGPTTGPVAVLDAIPSGLTLESMAGTGWTCPAGSNGCTRSDVLAAGASYPAITVTVDVAEEATSPQVNSVTVSGGGSGSATATDSTVIVGGTSSQVIVADFGGDYNYEEGIDDKQRIDGKTPPLQIVLTNTSPTQTVTFSGKSVDNPAYTVGMNCTTLAPGQSCIVTASFATTSACQNQFANITVQDNDPGGNLLLGVNGFGADNAVQVNDLTDPNLSAQALAQSLVGSGVTISNVKYTGSARAAGNFTSATNIFGFTSGLVLSSGSVRNVVGPNCVSGSAPAPGDNGDTGDTGISVDNVQPGDLDLNTIVGEANTTEDAAVLEFDFVPTSTNLSFQYVFASDEYNEFVGDFNDVFGFFLTAPDGSPVNIALIPGTNLPVSINNVNDGNPNADPPVAATNPQFYINNEFLPATAPLDTEMNGLTSVFTAQATVTPGQTYHIKLAIADANDHLYDSNVFVQSGSLSSANVTANPTSLAFGNQAQGTTSTSQPVVITNVGTATVTITNIVASTNFGETNTCPTTLTAGGGTGSTCSVFATFTPTATGALTGTVTVTYTNAGSTTPQTTTITLTGTGTAATGGTITITPTPLPFGLEGIGLTTPPETLTVSNTGNTAVTFTSIAMTGDFAGATLAQCPSIAVGAAPCKLQITFTPTAAGTRNGTITFTDNATGSPQTVNLSGTGVAVAIGITPTSLTFGSQAVGTTSAGQTVTVSNNGNFPLNFSSIVTSGDFAGATLAQCPSIGEENPPCVFSITFKPTGTGTRTGAITFTDNGTGSPQTVTLTGTGTPGTATVTVTPSSLAFSPQALSTTSAPMSVTVTNTSTAAVNFSGFTVTGTNAGDFGVPLPNASGMCSPTGTLAAGASCTINVLFTPGANGARTATLNIADSATGSPQMVALSGTGVTSSVIITVPPGGSTTATTVSGGTAYYGLLIQGATGVTGTVQLGCVPNSALITCKVIPDSVLLTGKSTEVAFAIQTFCQGATTSTGFVPPVGGIGGGIGLLLISMVFGGALWTFRRNRRVALTFATLLLVALGSAACSNSLPQGPNGATPAGTYMLSLTTSLNGAPPQTLNNFLTLVVK
jgi:Bacterial Ig-like domain (group 2)/Divergent InlB B-repeat domain